MEKHSLPANEFFALANIKKLGLADVKAILASCGITSGRLYETAELAVHGEWHWDLWDLCGQIRGGECFKPLHDGDVLATAVRPHTTRKFSVACYSTDKLASVVGVNFPSSLELIVANPGDKHVSVSSLSTPDVLGRDKSIRSGVMCRFFEGEQTLVDGGQIRLKIRPNLHFRLPYPTKDTAPHVIAFAAGTGFAPFRGMLQQCAARAIFSPSNQAGCPFTLFQGTKSDNDMHCKDELERLKHAGQLSLTISQSRIGHDDPFDAKHAFHRVRDAKLKPIFERHLLSNWQTVRAATNAVRFQQRAAQRPTAAPDGSPLALENAAGASALAPSGLAVLRTVTATAEFPPADQGDLGLKVGDVVHVTDDATEWWQGYKEGDESFTVGMFPSNHTDGSADADAGPAGDGADGTGLQVTAVHDFEVRSRRPRIFHSRCSMQSKRGARTWP